MPAPGLAEIYKIVREAQLAAQSVIRAGIDSVEVDSAARDFDKETPVTVRISVTGSAMEWGWLFMKSRDLEKSGPGSSGSKHGRHGRAGYLSARIRGRAARKHGARYEYGVRIADKRRLVLRLAGVEAFET